MLQLFLSTHLNLLAFLLPLFDILLELKIYEFYNFFFNKNFWYIFFELNEL